MTRWMAGLAGTALAVGLWTGSGAAELLTGKQVLELSDVARTFYISGVADGNDLGCPPGVRLAAVKAQAEVLMRESPEATGTLSIAVAMYQLGCRSIHSERTTRVPA